MIYPLGGDTCRGGIGTNLGEIHQKSSRIFFIIFPRSRSGWKFDLWPFFLSFNMVTLTFLRRNSTNSSAPRQPSHDKTLLYYSRGIHTENVLLFRCKLMILHLLRMRRNVNRNVFNDRKNVSATPSQRRALARLVSFIIPRCCGNIAFDNIALYRSYLS